MSTSAPIKLALPKVQITPDGGSAIALECMSNELEFGAVVDEETASFCSPDGVGEPYFEVNVATSYDFLNALLDNVGDLVDAVIIGDRQAYEDNVNAADTDNWVWAGKVKVPVLETVLNADIRGYTRQRVRFESDGNAWTVDKGAGAVAVSGWRGT